MVVIKSRFEKKNNKDSYKDIIIKNLKFNEDKWDLSNYIETKTIRNDAKKINFSFIRNEDMKTTVKLYAQYRLGKVKAQTVANDINSKLPLFIKYCELNKINNFNEITKEIFLEYALWLKNEKRISQGSGYSRCKVIEEIIKIGQIKGWNVPKTNIFIDFTSRELWNVKTENEKNKIESIPQSVLDKILYYAINHEKDILTKAGIILLSQTGIRINEMLSLKEGSIYEAKNGQYYMGIITKKAKIEKMKSIKYLLIS